MTSVTTTTATLFPSPSQDLVQARADLMRRQRYLIAQASAHARQQGHKPASSSQEDGDKKQPNQLAAHPPPAARTQGLGSFLQTKTSSSKINAQEVVKDSASVEFTVATVESDEPDIDNDNTNEAVLSRLQDAVEQQQARVHAVQEHVEAQQDLAQVLYMARDKAGATAAMRTARHWQAAVAQDGPASPKPRRPPESPRRAPPPTSAQPRPVGSAAAPA